MKIIFKKENYKKIQAVLDTVQKNKKVRTIEIKDIEKMLKTIIDYPIAWSKRSLNGSEFILNFNAQDFPNAYKYTPYATFIKVTMKNGNWQIVDVYRDICKNKKIECKLSETAKEYLIKQAFNMNTWWKI